MAPFKVTDMPALTIDAQSHLTNIESKYHSIMSGHCHGYTLSDSDGALEKIRTFATVFFDFYYSFYSKFPTYFDHWQIASEAKALERIRVQLENFTALRDWVDASVVYTIKVTITNHAKTKVLPQIIMPVAAKYPALGIGAESPLLKMLAASPLKIPNPNPIAVRRKAFVQPLLDAKGWDVARWAKQANVTRHTANNYLEGKRKTYHTSMTELAKALGVSFQDFPK